MCQFGKQNHSGFTKWKLQKTKRSKRTLSARSLVALGVGAIIGAGLFSLTGISSR
jgi:amino acid permease